MKKHIILSIFAAAALCASAQDFDTKPCCGLENKAEMVKFTIGGRFMADAAWYHNDFTPMQSGATIADARIRTSASYKDYYFYADFGFGGGKFAQKNIFLQWAHQNEVGNTHAVKVGYYNDPAGSMAKITSLGSYHFISRAGSANSLGDGRALGVSYKFNNANWQAYQGIFSENQYNKIEAGFNGITVAGRWLYRPIVDENQTLHVGLHAALTHLGGGVEKTTKGSTVLQKNYTIAQTMETYVDEDTQFLGCTLPWANNVIKLGAEALYHNDKFFARGEYLHKTITKSRDTYKIFIAAQDNIDGWGDVVSWETANPLATNHFNGGYVEAGYMLWSKDGKARYQYDSDNGTLKGLNAQALEVVGRVNVTNLNQINEGDYYSAGRDQYYPGGYMQDWPYSSTSVGGGRVVSATVGLNYSLNRFAQIMLDYTYSNLDRDKYPYDKNFHSVQGRVQFIF